MLEKHVARVVPRALQGRAARRDRGSRATATGASCKAVINGAFTVPGDGAIDFAGRARRCCTTTATTAGWSSRPSRTRRSRRATPTPRRATGTCAGSSTRWHGKAAQHEPARQGARARAATIVDVTPRRAGWTLRRLPRASPRARASASTLALPGREVCIVVLAGRVDVAAAGGAWTRPRRPRQRVRRPRRRAAVYLPDGASVDGRPRAPPPRSAWARAPGGGKLPPRADRPGHDEAQRARQGQQHALRLRHPAGGRAAPSTCWWSRCARRRATRRRYPPHKHDTDALPAETQLEETYYHRLDPPQGFAFQRVYTDDRSLDESLRRRGPRRGDGAARLPPGRRAARLRARTT